MKTLYKLTQQEAKILLNNCNNNTETLAVVLWNKGKSKNLESAVKKAIKIKKFALCQ